MKNIFVLTLFLVCGSAFAQQKKDTTEIYYYKPRFYNPSSCGCFIIPKRDSIYIKKDTIKPVLNFTFVRKKEKKKEFG